MIWYLRTNILDIYTRSSFMLLKQTYNYHMTRIYHFKMKFNLTKFNMWRMALSNKPYDSTVRGSIEIIQWLPFSLVVFILN